MSNPTPAVFAPHRAPGPLARVALLVATCALAAACGGARASGPSRGLPSSYDGAARGASPGIAMTRDDMVKALTLGAPVRGARVAVQPHVRVDGDLSRDARHVASRTRAVLEDHPDLTTDVDGGRAMGLSLVLLDAVTTCEFRDQEDRARLDCAVRFSLADGRGKIVAAWGRSVSVTGRRGEDRRDLIDDAVGHALQGLPEQILQTHDANAPAASRSIALTWD